MLLLRPHRHHLHHGACALKNTRVYILAKQLGQTAKALTRDLRALGIEVTSHMSTLTPEQVAAVRARYEPRSPPAVLIRKPQPQSEGPSRRKVVDEHGTIVGFIPTRTATVLGRIELPTRRVIVTPAPPESKEGRVSAKRKTRHKARPKPRQRPRRRHEPPANNTAQMGEHKRRVRVDGSIAVSALARALSQKAPNVVRVLWRLGQRGATVNTTLDFDIAGVVAAEFGYTVEDASFQEAGLLATPNSGQGPRRPPVVTVMGHVDHGKTTLLDHLRRSRVAQGEAGGITQHLGAYTVGTTHGDIVFLDTPGHAAFKAMRRRGTRVTDLVVLVVAADDGVMPTTLEAIEAAREAKTPIVVAITKIDRADANPGRVEQDLMRHGLIGEAFGGDTSLCRLSAITGAGVQDLLETLALYAEVLDLRASREGPASGTVLESRVEKGRGVVTTVLVDHGTLRRGDTLVVGMNSGRVRSLRDCAGAPTEETRPGYPVEVIGLDDVPSPGERFAVVDDERVAKQLVSHRQNARRRAEGASAPRRLARFEDLRVPTLEVLVCADTRGSAEVVTCVIDQLSTPKVRARVVTSGVGAISENDVKVAAATGAIIVGFGVEPGGKAAALARAGGVPILRFDVLYAMVDALEQRMVDLLEPVTREGPLGEAIVRARFPIPKVGVVAGCRVTKGKVTRHSHVRVLREAEVVFSGRVGSLRKVDEDVAEVGEGHECGIVLSGFADVRPDDVLETFQLETIKPTLEP